MVGRVKDLAVRRGARVRRALIPLLNLLFLHSLQFSSRLAEGLQAGMDRFSLVISSLLFLRSPSRRFISGSITVLKRRMVGQRRRSRLVSQAKSQQLHSP